MPPQEAVERLSNGLMQMLKRLEPVAGPVLHARMLALAQWVKKMRWNPFMLGTSNKDLQQGPLLGSLNPATVET